MGRSKLPLGDLWTHSTSASASPPNQEFHLTIHSKSTLFKLKTIPLHTLRKSLSPAFLLAHFKDWMDALRSPQSLLQAEQHQLPQPVLIGEVLQPLDHPCGPCLD